MKLFRKSTNPEVKPMDSSEVKINTIIDLIKDLEQTDYNRLREGMDLIYKGYQKVRKSKTKNEKDYGEIDKAEEFLEAKK